MFFITMNSMPCGFEHGAFGFEDTVFAAALLVVVVDDEDGEGVRHRVLRIADFP